LSEGRSVREKGIGEIWQEADSRRKNAEVVFEKEGRGRAKREKKPSRTLLNSLLRKGLGGVKIQMGEGKKKGKEKGGKGRKKKGN